MRKKTCIVGGLGVVVTVVVAAAVVRYLSTTSTHHAQMWIRAQEYETEKNRMLRDYESVVQAVETWAGPAGFYRLPQDMNLPRMRWFGSGTERNERCVWFQEKTPNDKSFPREVMVVCDPDGPADIQILLAEGYSRRPSRQLQALYEALRQRLEQVCPGKVRGSIW